ncbi:uncharacterized protein LOC115363688 [Myripristis murdjan]|uniref:uncharacterized protein LOC115363688 n=1 Tax=Myripristis murdjan TaxID=586833 RepID=UPI001176467F|nr:uncharacterized protein LOC115363688 [Myripristis murdjan]
MAGRCLIILTPTMVQSLELLVEERSSCGVGESIYLFARPGFDTRLRGSNCIRELAKNCGAKKPEALSSTKLRKQVATLSRVLNLNDTEQDLLVDFLGHDIRVHRKFYRLLEGTLQLAKISKVLMACEQGRLAEFKGKILDQISISPNDQSEVMEESSGESSENEDHPAAPAGEESVTREEKGTSKQQLGRKRGLGGGASVTRQTAACRRAKLTHIAKLVWPNSGPHNALTLGRHTAKNDGPLVARISFARAGPYMGQHKASCRHTAGPVLAPNSFCTGTRCQP